MSRHHKRKYTREHNWAQQTTELSLDQYGLESETTKIPEPLLVEAHEADIISNEAAAMLLEAPGSTPGKPEKKEKSGLIKWEVENIMHDVFVDRCVGSP